jgi:hypothetical protein
MMSEWLPVIRTLIQGRELHDVIIPIGERGLTNSVVTTSSHQGQEGEEGKSLPIINVQVWQGPCLDVSFGSFCIK